MSASYVVGSGFEEYWSGDTSIAVSFAPNLTPSFGSGNDDFSGSGFYPESTTSSTTTVFNEISFHQICPEFFHFSHNIYICEPNVCQCEQGIPTDPCPVHNSISCQSCPEFHHPDKGQCWKNTCTCINGVAVEACVVHRFEMCQSCYDGYVWKIGRCFPGKYELIF